MTDIAVQAMEALHNCRCCLRRPPDKGLKTMYESVGKTEVYWEMLKQCFDIRLNLGNDECGICEVCVNRLRDANDFKNQVQQSQVDLKSLLERALAEKDKKPDIVKVEIVEEDPISAEPLIRQDPKKEFKSESDGDLVSKLLFDAPTPAAASDPESDNDSSDSEPRDKAEYKCKKCRKTFDQEESLTRHMFAIHAKHKIPVPAKKINTCKFCCQWFTEKIDLENHMEIHKVTEEITDDQFSCEVCDQKFTEDSQLKEHELDEHNIYRGRRDDINAPNKNAERFKDDDENRKIYQCELCQKIYYSGNGLKSHMMIHAGEKPHTCDVCQKKFRHKGHLKVHIQIHSQNRQYPFNCDVCDKKFTLKSALVRHIRTHTGEKPHACEICKKQFALQTTLDSHMCFHRGEKPFSCEICQKTFAFKYTLQKHRRFHSETRSQKKSLTCEVCAKQFTLKRNLEKHLLTHTDAINLPNCTREESFCCEICGRRFRQKSYLARHLKGHTGVKPHACDVCDKRFTEKSSLKAHKKIHTGEKEYSCEICRKQFGLKATLKNHMIIHTGQKPHACRICNKQFSYKCALNVHLKSVHFRERPHVCHVCKKSFALISTLKIHLLSHTGMKPFSCHICGKAFAVRYALKKHLSTHSGASTTNRAHAANRVQASHYRPFLSQCMN
ncbi:oocyte zinc finger protein XlCOF6-like isoform X2 [Cydia amplana]|uniref:oocyte zinc finger protein XlCOF6-like isoform X2 n=1 Tax=Cydia amplana TaxID=1869771 RepID=UPI002FE53764